MPTIRPYKIIDDEYVDQESYTIDLDLPTSGILSSLMLMVKARTDAEGLCPIPWIKYLISSISVNQAGQAFLNAAPPEVFQADHYYKTGRMPRRGYEVMGGAAGEIVEEVPILFGDKLNDMEHTIDLSKLNDPKLSVTYDLAATSHNDDDVWDTTYKPRFTVIAHLIQGEGIPASKGYHSLRQIESYTPTDSQAKKIELKGARPIKRIFPQFDMKLMYFGWVHSLDTIKLWGDNEAWTPFIQKVDDWYELIRDVFGLCTVEGYSFYAKHGQEVDTGVDKRVMLSIFNNETELEKCFAYAGSGRMTGLRTKTMSTGALYATPIRIMYNFKGYTPMSIGVIDMPKMLGMDYLDPTEHAPVYLELDHRSDASGPGGPVKIHIEDLAPPL